MDDPQPYWEDYYRTGHAPVVPSQFAVFVRTEYPDAAGLIDFACGSGRDSFFFASHQVPTLGIDASASAIDVCNRIRVQRNVDGVTFTTGRVEEALSNPDVEAFLTRVTPDRTIVLYARFFLHAVNEETEEAFLALAGRLLSQRSGALATEFRTVRDKEQPKITAGHYRRFVDPLRLIGRAQRHGLRPDYFVEGFGFAKYKADDAHVARCIFVATDVIAS
jgi:ubiquinone/menaquinone biosynthesis C-methylase UbiE